MLYINLSKEKNLESALKKLKYKFEKVGTKKELLARKEFIKPSVLKRRDVLKASYIQQLRSLEDRD
jgi:small subunit ribosomal protein S21